MAEGRRKEAAAKSPARSIVMTDLSVSRQLQCGKNEGSRQIRQSVTNWECT
jgi:hypothetical protein